MEEIEEQGTGGPWKLLTTALLTFVLGAIVQALRMPNLEDVVAKVSAASSAVPAAESRRFDDMGNRLDRLTDEVGKLKDLAARTDESLKDLRRVVEREPAGRLGGRP